MKSLTTSSSIFQATKLKICTQQLKHDEYRNQANQEQLQPFFMMSPSDLSATPSSECLQERCSRHHHWETYDNKTNLKQLAKQHVDPRPVIRCILPPFKLTPALCAQPYRPFWKQQVNLELTKSTILLLSHQTNSGAFGNLFSGNIPAGTRSSPLSGHTLAGQMPPYPSPGHGDQWVIHTECGP